MIGIGLPNAKERNFGLALECSRPDEKQQNAGEVNAATEGML